MSIKIITAQVFSSTELTQRLRNVTMLEDRSVKPYENAMISLEKIAVEDLFPAQRYVLKRELEKVRALKWELQKHGIDIFNLDGFVRMEVRDSDEPVDLLPPIIEESIERNGRITHIINDGMHRIFLAYLEWVIPQVVFIRGVPKDLPYYAYPIPEKNWSAIEMRDSIPPELLKKWHRIEKNKQLYRDFNSAFKNVGGPRGRTSNQGKGH